MNEATKEKFAAIAWQAIVAADDVACSLEELLEGYELVRSDLLDRCMDIGDEISSKASK